MRRQMVRQHWPLYLFLLPAAGCLFFRLAVHFIIEPFQRIKKAVRILPDPCGFLQTTGGFFHQYFGSVFQTYICH